MSDNAIADVSAGLVALLRGVVSQPPFAGGECRLVSGRQLEKPFPEGVSVYLHRVVPEFAPRNGLPVPGGASGLRLPLVMSLHYLICASAVTPERQQLLLARAALAVCDNPILSGSIQLTIEQLSLAEELSIWQVAPMNHQPSLYCLARAVPIA
jgi:hypothetical protein